MGGERVCGLCDRLVDYDPWHFPNDRGSVHGTYVTADLDPALITKHPALNGRCICYECRDLEFKEW